MTEKEIERRVVKMVRERGGLSYKFVSPNTPGVPDRIVITPTGVVWFVELKTDTGEASKMPILAYVRSRSKIRLGAESLTASQQESPGHA